MKSKGIQLAYAGLKNHLTEDGLPILYDWYAIALSFDDEEAMITALLYGALSSEHFTLDDIREMGFPDTVIRALQILKVYDENKSVNLLKNSVLAWRVKYAELRHKEKEGRTRKNDVPFWEERLELDKDFFVPFCPRTKEVQIKESIMMNRRHAGPILGCLIGGAVGDSIGYGVIREDGIRLISSNTQECLFTATGSLYAWSHFYTWGFDATEIDYIFYALQDWAGQGINPTRNISWIKSIPEMVEYRSPDIASINLLLRGKCGSLRNPISSNCSASALSRVAPLVAHNKNDYHPDNIRRVMKLAAQVTAITHGSLLAILSSAFLAQLLSRYMYGGCVGEYLIVFLREGKRMLFEFMGDSTPLNQLFSKLDEAVIRAGNNQNDGTNIEALGEGWVAHEALAIAVYCAIRHPLKFNSAVTAAASHKGNTATTACLTGQLMGAKLGIENIGQSLIDGLECKTVIEEIGKDLIDECHLTRKSEEWEDSKWRAKYVQCDFHL